VVFPGGLGRWTRCSTADAGADEEAGEEDYGGDLRAGLLEALVNLEMLVEKGAIAPSDWSCLSCGYSGGGFRILKDGLTENHLESAYEREQQRLERERIPVSRLRARRSCWGRYYEDAVGLAKQDEMGQKSRGEGRFQSSFGVDCGGSKNKQQQRQDEIRGFFAALRMTTFLPPLAFMKLPSDGDS